MLVLSLFLVYISICMAVFDPDSCYAGYSAQKNVFRGCVIKTKEYSQIIWKEYLVPWQSTVGFLI